MSSNDKAKKLSAAKRLLKEFQKKQTDFGVGEQFSNPGSADDEHRSGPNGSLPYAAYPPHQGNADYNPQQLVPTTQDSLAQTATTADDIEHLQLARNLSPDGQAVYAGETAVPPIVPQAQVHHSNSSSSQKSDSQHVAQIEELKSYNVSLQQQILDEREKFGQQLQVQLGQLREQIQIHAQTIGILVGEKSQLQAALSQSKVASESRQNENQELNGRLAASRQRVADLEKQTTLSTDQLQKAEKNIADLTKQVDKLRSENASGSQSTQELKRRHDELQERFLNKESECSQLMASTQALKNELHMTKAYLEQISASASKADVEQSQHLSSENEQLKAQTTELERMLRSAQESAESLRAEKDNFKRRHETDLSGLEDHIKMLNGRINAQTNEIEGHLQRNSELETQLGEMVEKLKGKDKAIENQQVENEMELNQEKAKDAAITAMNQQLAQAKRDLEELVTKNVALHQGLVDKDATVEMLRGRIAELERASSDYRSVLANVEDVRTALSRALGQNSQLKQEYEELQTAFVRITNEKAELAEKLSSQARPNEQGQNHEECSQKIAQLEAQIVALENRPLPAGVHDECEKKRNELEVEIARVSAAGRNHEACQRKIVQLETHISKLQSQKDALQSGNHEDCQKKIASLESQVSELEARTQPDGQVTSSAQVQELERKLAELESSQDHAECEKKLKEAEGKDDHAECEKKIDDLEKKVADLERATANDSRASIDMETFAQADKSQQLETVQGALEALETRFSRVMREKADLIDQKERLEHLVIQLQSETDTIGEYITLYQKQRSTLKQQSEENANFMEQLTSERQSLKKRMEELQSLVLKLVASKNQEPVRILSTGPDHNDDDDAQSVKKESESGLQPEDEEWPDLVGDEPNDSNLSSQSAFVDAQPVDPVSSQILQLLTAMTSSMLTHGNDGNYSAMDGLSIINPDDHDASILNQMTPNTRRLVHHRLHSLRSTRQSPGECPCCKGQVLVI